MRSIKRLLRNISWFTIAIGLFVLFSSVIGDTGEGDFFLAGLILLVGFLGVYRTRGLDSSSKTTYDPYDQTFYETREKEDVYEEEEYEEEEDSY